MIIFKKLPDPGDEFDRSELEYTVGDSEINIDDLLDEFGYFLRGCGYVFSGSVEIVDSE